MSSLTRCTAVDHAPRALPAPRLLKIMVVLAVALVFGLAHLHLRFSLNELRSETIRLQSLQETLRSNINALRGETGALKRSEQLYNYASNELGMVPYKIENRVNYVIPEEIYARYAMARAAHDPATDDRIEFADSQARWLEALSDRIGLIGMSMAGQTSKE
ncbi:MAG: hypothetical protein M1457_03095 [bacterium]|nr:hypothetical protein [bacterium]